MISGGGFLNEVEAQGAYMGVRILGYSFHGFVWETDSRFYSRMTGR